MAADQAKPQGASVPTDIGAAFSPPQAPVSVKGGSGSADSVPLGFAPPNPPVPPPIRPGSPGLNRK